ncbi:MAG: DMT family transporter [Pseudomonadota bacterium]
MAGEPPELTPAHRAVFGAKFKAWAILLGAGGVWGVTFSLAKIATEGGAHPFGITLWQAIIGCALLFLFDLARRRALPLDRQHLTFYLVCGLLGTAIPASLYFYAAPHLPAGVLSITIATVPMMTFLGAHILGVDRLSATRLLGVMLGVVAVMLIAAPETSLPDPASAPWVLVAVVASLCYAAENLYIAKRRPVGSDAITVLCGMLLVAALVLTPVVLATGTFTPLPWPWGPVELSVLAMSLINVVSYGLFVYLVTASGPVFASQMAYVVTLSGVFWGMVIYGELHSAWIWAALVAMMAGLALVKPKK